MPRIIVITGNGKGKTTSALGMALRAIGHGMKVAIIQFIKNDPDTGEIAALSKISDVEFIQSGCGFIRSQDSPEFSRHCDTADNGLQLAHGKLQNTSIDMVILDEICGAMHLGLISENSVIDTIKTAHKNAIIICTGRNAPDSLISLADTVNVIDSIKHGFKNGIKAQKGVEF